jgi:two-component system NarL family response regulator
MARIAIIEDTAEIAAKVQNVVRGSGDFELAGWWNSAEAAIRELPRRGADLCVLDIGLPGMDGISAVEKLRASLPEMKIVIFTVFEDSDHILRAIRSGANGYLLKDTEPNLFISELKTVLLGGASLTTRVAQRIFQMMPETQTVQEASEEAAEEAGLLTPRQVDILNHIALGFDYREIADELDISEHTVRRHIENIYQRLQVNSRKEAIKAGFKLGFLRYLG